MSQRIVWLSLGCLLSLPLAAEEFSFDFAQYERKTWELSGFAQVAAQSIEVNQHSAFNALSPADERFERYLAELELGGLYRWQQTSLHALAKVNGLDDGKKSEADARFYELYLHYQPNKNWQFELGQRSLRWGKGYAFNPVAVLERPKDALDPELSREGFVLASADWVRSLGELGTVSLTTVLLPVTEELNDEFGQTNKNNVAAKLSWVLGKTDMDIIWRNQASRAAAIGVDFSHSLAVNFAIHGEVLWATRSRKLIDNNGAVAVDEVAGADVLVGLRYLTNNETTWIAELYHQSAGYDRQQMRALYDYAVATNPQLLQTKLENSRYLAPQAMQNYASIKLTQKEPWDKLYWTVGLGTIVNLHDGSAIITPELIYNGVMNWEARARVNYFSGDSYSEYGERQNASRAELQVRRYF